MQIFTPGRTEIIGNHTDHQMGRVIAAAVRLGITAEVDITTDNIVRIKSCGYGNIEVDITDVSPREEEKLSAAALVRGMAAAFLKRGYAVGGFAGAMRSDLPVGGGMSSSAAFAVSVGRIFSALCNGGSIAAEEIARCAQYAENYYFGKPSGLMDQLACALGGMIYIDFLTGEIVPLRCDFGAMGLRLCLTNTGGSHAHLTDAYAQIPADMCAAAAEFGQERLGYVNYDDFLCAAPPPDRVHNRARHFFEENARVEQMRRALCAGDAPACLALMNASGRSSERLMIVWNVGWNAARSCSAVSARGASTAVGLPVACRRWCRSSIWSRIAPQWSACSEMAVAMLLCKQNYVNYAEEERRRT